MNIENLENVGEVEQIIPSEWKWTVKNLKQQLQGIDDELLVWSPKFSMKQSNQTTNWRLGYGLKCIGAKIPKIFLLILENLNEIGIIASITWLGISTSDPIRARPTTKLTFSHQSIRHGILVSDYDYRNNLNLHCSIVVDSEPVIRASEEVNLLSATTNSSAVLCDFEKLLDNNKHSDVTFLLPHNKQIYAHKAILSSRSRVFEAMFEHDMKEKQLNTVEVTDVEYKILKELLRFVYAGRVEDIDNVSRELLIAADKYAVDGLKVLCENSIFKQLNIDNVLEICQLATVYNAVDLKSKVYEYIVEHIKNICKKPEFKHLDPVIKDELFAVLADKI